MSKSKLQEICHKNKWGLPEYATVRDGPDHKPRFTGTVTVNGVTFESPPGECRSSKEAQNEAAKIAIACFMDPTFTSQQSMHPNSPLPQQPSGSLNSSASFAVETGKSTMVEPKNPQNLLVAETQKSSGKDESSKDMLHLYKNRLQNYAQKRNLTLPTYSYDIVGPPHDRRFKSKVTIDGKSFEATNFFTTLKDAEYSAAKVAFESMSLHEIQEDEGLYKSLLQEFAQRNGLQFPAYETERFGPPHSSIFISNVNIGGKSFQGELARTKKLAEMDAAKAAYIGLTESQAMQSTSAVSYHYEGPLDASTSNLHPNVAQNVDEDVNISIEGHTEEIKDTGRRHGNSSASEDAHAQEKDLSSATKSPTRDTEDGACSSSLSMLMSDIKACIKTSSGEQDSDVKTIVVCPRIPNMAIPEGATILPIGGDQWVAMRLPAEDDDN